MVSAFSNPLIQASRSNLEEADRLPGRKLLVSRSLSRSGRLLCRRVDEKESESDRSESTLRSSRSKSFRYSRRRRRLPPSDSNFTDSESSIGDTRLGRRDRCSRRRRGDPQSLPVHDISAVVKPLQNHLPFLIKYSPLFPELWRPGL